MTIKLALVEKHTNTHARRNTCKNCS